MCGIAGMLVGLNGRVEPSEVVAGMTARLVHRGPDDSGLWQDPQAGVALGHRRLSIIDTSSGGHQPMRSPSGQLVVCFNGEIYNFQEIRSDLQKVGFSFRTHSDTEVLVAAVECWGIEAALNRLVGMFAFAIWDSGRRTLVLARDRAGEKPLYWGLAGGDLLFASELQSFHAHPAFSREVDPDSFELFLRHAYVPAPRTIYRAVHKLPPGTYATVRRTGSNELSVELKAYWSLPVGTGRSTIEYEEARRQAEFLLSRAVKGQLVSDVPLGAFLSGGIDSTAIVALMQENSSSKVRTFSLGSSESAYDESRFAAAVAAHIGTDHTELRVTPAEALEVVPQLGSIYDEPFADSSQIPTLLVARLARKSVTVALSGDAGDEVFGGYNRYIFAPRLWSSAGRWPVGLRRAASAGMSAVPHSWWDTASGVFARATGRQSVRLLGEKVGKIARALPAGTPLELYERLAACWTDPPVARSSAAPQARWYNLPAELTGSDQRFVELMMHVDFLTYLPDDILVKVDRACMSASLEGRVPILDHRLVEFMAPLPQQYKLDSTGSKRILRDIVYSRVPRELLDRPKTGFGVPIDSWLRGPLREWAEALLDERVLREQGHFDAAKVRAAWSQHLSGHRLRHHEIWSVLMFQAWRAASLAR